MRRTLKIYSYSELYADAAQPVINEVDIYIYTCNKSTNILGNWKTKATMLPKLTQVAP